MVVITIHAHGFVMALHQWHMLYKLGEDELHRAPVVALRRQRLKMQFLYLHFKHPNNLRIRSRKFILSTLNVWVFEMQIRELYFELHF